MVKQSLMLRMEQHLLESYNRYQMVSCMIQKEGAYLCNLTSYISLSGYVPSLLMGEKEWWYGLRLDSRFRKHLRYLNIRLWYCLEMQNLIMKHGIKAKHKFAMLLWVRVVHSMILKM